ncbi:MAG: hypothetical protein NT090_03455 [Acidobacteria bacterium]|nr:hypothetical protein [Acidobacteriota bacterium]
MSTIGTQLNWGASYLVNDFYRRFLKTNGDEKHYVRISQWATVLLTLERGLVAPARPDLGVCLGRGSFRDNFQASRNGTHQVAQCLAGGLIGDN